MRLEPVANRAHPRRPIGLARRRALTAGRISGWLTWWAPNARSNFKSIRGAPLDLGWREPCQAQIRARLAGYGVRALGRPRSVNDFPPDTQSRLDCSSSSSSKRGVDNKTLPWRQSARDVCKI